MADITWTEVVAQPNSTELATVSVAWQNVILAFVNAEVNETTLGHKATLAKIYLASHFAAMDLVNANSGAGPITSKKLAGKAVSYGTGGSFSMDLLSETGYGRNYLALVRGASTMGPMVI